MNITKILLACCLILLNVPLLTQAADRFEPPIYTCSTTSNGLVFSNQSRDVYLARQTVQQQCQADQRTSNDECNANVACNDGSPVPPIITCSTSSNGLTFSDESRDPNIARQHAQAQCSADQRTSNDECNANIACNDGSRTNPMITCSTTSNGLNFSDISRDPNVARQHAGAQCIADQRTSNDECNANLICNDGRPIPPMMICSTFSRGLTFSDESRDPNVARQHAQAQCIADQRTSNNECNANIACEIEGGQYPSPNPYPAPTPIPTPYPPAPPTPSCIANRYDPAGMFIQNYEARDCQGAMAQCNSEIRGRQYCSIVR